MWADPTRRMLGPFTYEEVYRAERQADVEQIAHRLAVLGAGSVDDLIPVVDADPARAFYRAELRMLGLDWSQVDEVEQARLSVDLVRAAMGLATTSLFRLQRQIAALPLGARKAARRERKRHQKRKAR